MCSSDLCIERQQIDARVTCLEEQALSWALAHEGVYATAQEWDDALVAEFPGESAQEARSSLRSMRYAGKNLEEHEATFLRRVASVPGMTEGEKVDLWINSFGNLPEMRAQIDRAGPETWKHAAKIARREDRLRRTAQQSYGVPASEGSEAAYGRTATSHRQCIPPQHARRW